MPQVIDGNKTARVVKDSVKQRIDRMETELGIRPGLAVVLVGEDPASCSYVQMKERDCEEVGIQSFDHRLPEDVTQEELEALIDTLNDDSSIHGILVQMPLPTHLDEEAIISRIAAAKDVDGFHPASMGSLLRGLPTLRACTPHGVMRLLDEYDIDVSGKHAVVVGRSNIVGKPQAVMLLERDATVTVCHSRTDDLARVCRQADILVAAVGRAHMIDEDYIKPGATIIDVGINRVEEGLVGDVDYEVVAPLAGAITPVPGGVGPMTRAMLMQNTVDACAAQLNYRDE